MNKIREILFLLKLKRVGEKAVYNKYLDLLDSIPNVDELIDYFKNETSFTAEDIEAAQKESNEDYKRRLI